MYLNICFAYQTKEVPMAKMIFVNLPVMDFQRSIDFYRALGFTQNMDFSNDLGAALV